MRPLEPLAVPLGGTRLVEASAGTGKTYAITSLYLRLVLERGLGVDRVLVVTFTRAATAELRDRLRSRLRAAVAALAVGGDPEDAFLDALARSRPDPAADRRRLLEELRRFDEAAIHTIHGFCQRVLQDHAFESGVAFDAELAPEGDPLLEEVAHDFFTARVAAAEEAFVGFLRSERFGPEGLVCLARAALADPDLRILPEASAERYGEALAAAEAAHRALVGRWPGDRAAVMALTRPQAALKGNVWTAANHPRRLARLETLLGPGAPLPSAVDADWACFSPEALRQATRKGHAPPEHPLFEGIRGLIEAVQALAEASQARRIALQREFLDFARREVRRRREAAGTLAFEDLLQRLDEALGSAGGKGLGAAVRRRYAAALIDEFQDTDPIQYRIFRRLFQDGETSLFLIGDPKQAIYGFRSADVFAYLEAARAAGEERYTLETNWRSDPGLVSAVNRIFSRAASPFLLRGIPFAPVAPRPGAAPGLQGPAPYAAPFEVLWVPGAALPEGGAPATKGAVNAALPALVAAEIGRLLAAGVTLPSAGGAASRPLAPGDVAVLVRRNREGQAIQGALRAAGLPSVLHSDATVLETAEATELVCLLQALALPSHGGRLRLALATELVGLGAEELLALGEEEARLEAWSLRLRSWAEIFEARGFLPAYARIFAELDVPARTLATPGGERRLTNLVHLGELLHLAARRQRVGAEGLARWLLGAIQGAPTEGVTDRDARQLRVESDTRAVQVLTIHKSKGLEFPVVLCPFLWAGDWDAGTPKGHLRAHDPAEPARRVLDLGSAERGPLERHWRIEALAEGLRLAYVALTRARHRCAIFWGPWSGAAESALGYLLHQGGVPEAPVEAFWERVAARVRAMGEEAMRADLVALAEGSFGAVTLREVAPLRERYAAPYEPEAGPLACRTFRREVDQCFRTSSFSALVAGAEAAASPASHEGRDRDERPLAAAEDVVASLPSQERSEPVAAAPSSAAAALEGFLRGARAGNLLHHLLERLDFGADPAARLEAVRRALRHHGVDPDLWGPRVEAALEGWLSLPMPITGGGAVVLSCLPASARRAELEFVLPVAHPEPARGVSTLLTPGRLAAVFAAHGGGAPHLAAYAPRLAGVRRLPLHGFLRGFIDLVFRHEGRYHVIDWKSNHLGPTLSDYAPSRLTDVMVDAHYVLQYHLYVVALHRHLRARLPGYDYEAHVGDAHYVFLRGRVPSGGPETGIFRDRPSRALVEDLSAVLDGTAVAGEGGPTLEPWPARGGRHG